MLCVGVCELYVVGFKKKHTFILFIVTLFSKTIERKKNRKKQKKKHY